MGSFDRTCRILNVTLAILFGVTLVFMSVTVRAQAPLKQPTTTAKQKASEDNFLRLTPDFFVGANSPLPIGSLALTWSNPDNRLAFAYQEHDQSQNRDLIRHVLTDSAGRPVNFKLLNCNRVCDAGTSFVRENDINVSAGLGAGYNGHDNGFVFSWGRGFGSYNYRYRPFQYFSPNGFSGNDNAVPLHPVIPYPYGNFLARPSGVAGLMVGLPEGTAGLYAGAGVPTIQSSTPPPPWDPTQVALGTPYASPYGANPTRTALIPVWDPVLPAKDRVIALATERTGCWTNFRSGVLDYLQVRVLQGRATPIELGCAQDVRFARLGKSHVVVASLHRTSIRLQRLNSSGVPDGTVTTIAIGDGQATSIDVAPLDDGVLLAWGGTDIALSLFDANLRPEGLPETIGDVRATGELRSSPSISTHPDGRIAVGWIYDAGPGLHGVQAAIYQYKSLFTTRSDSVAFDALDPSDYPRSDYDPFRALDGDDIVTLPNTQALFEDFGFRNHFLDENFFDGGPGDDRLNGSLYADFLSGGDDDDRIYGGEGRDKLKGDGGDDVLFGGPGDDLIAGIDSLTHENRLGPQSGTDRVVPEEGRDVIAFAGDDTNYTIIAKLPESLLDETGFTLQSAKRGADGDLSETTIFKFRVLGDTLCFRWRDFVAQDCYGSDRIIRLGASSLVLMLLDKPKLLQTPAYVDYALGIIRGAIRTGSFSNGRKQAFIEACVLAVDAGGTAVGQVVDAIAKRIPQAAAVGTALKLAVDSEFDELKVITRDVAGDVWDVYSRQPPTQAGAGVMIDAVFSRTLSQYLRLREEKVNIKFEQRYPFSIPKTNVPSLGEGTGQDDVIIRGPFGGVPMRIFDLLAGNDKLKVSGTVKVLAYGGAGNDRIETGGGADRLDGGPGVDVLIGGGGDDLYIIDTVADRIVERADGGRDAVQSVAAIDLSKLAFVEIARLTGMAAVGVLGSSRADEIFGNSGANRIEGASGADRLTGGAGGDTFLYRRVTDSTPTRTDLILDFSTRWPIDVLDLSLIDADVSSPGNDWFINIRDQPFSGRAGELRIYTVGQPFARDTFVEGDVNGDRKADLKIKIKGDVGLYDVPFIAGVPPNLKT